MRNLRGLRGLFRLLNCADGASLSSDHYQVGSLVCKIQFTLTSCLVEVIILL